MKETSKKSGRREGNPQTTPCRLASGNPDRRAGSHQGRKGGQPSRPATIAYTRTNVLYTNRFPCVRCNALPPYQTSYKGGLTPLQPLLTIRRATPEQPLSQGTTQLVDNLMSCFPEGLGMPRQPPLFLWFAEPHARPHHLVDNAVDPVQESHIPPTPEGNDGGHKAHPSFPSRLNGQAL